MPRRIFSFVLVALIPALSTVLVLATQVAASEETSPPAHVATPDVYRVMADSAGLRLIQAIYQPGQRSQWHSHPKFAAYFQTNCALRIHLPDGTSQTINPPGGWGSVEMPVKSHAFENIGDSECRILLVEQY